MSAFASAETTVKADAEVTQTPATAGTGAEAVRNEKWRRREAMRQADGRRAFLANPALWPEPKAQSVAQAAAVMDLSLLRWANACLDDPQGKDIGFLKIVHLRNRLRLETVLADTSHLTMETRAKLTQGDSTSWGDSGVALPEAERFREMVTAALPATASAEERAAAEFRVLRYEDSRAALQELLMLETLYEQKAPMRVRVSARAREDVIAPAEALPPPLPEGVRLEDVQAAIRADVDAAQELVRELNAAAAKGWPDYLKRHAAVGQAVMEPNKSPAR